MSHDIIYTSLRSRRVRSAGPQQGACGTVHPRFAYSRRICQTADDCPRGGFADLPIAAIKATCINQRRGAVARGNVASVARFHQIRLQIVLDARTVDNSGSRTRSDCPSARFSRSLRFPRFSFVKAEAAAFPHTAVYRLLGRIQQSARERDWPSGRQKASV